MKKYYIDLKVKGCGSDVSFSIIEKGFSNKRLFTYDPMNEMNDVGFEYFGNLFGKRWIFKGKSFERSIVFTWKILRTISRKSDGVIEVKLDWQHELIPVIEPLSEDEIIGSYDLPLMRETLKNGKVRSDEQLTHICTALSLCGEKEDIDLVMPYMPGGKVASLKRVKALMNLCIDCQYTPSEFEEIVSTYKKDLDPSLIRSWYSQHTS